MSTFKNVNFFGYVMIAFIIYIILKIYMESDYYNLICVVSDVDGNKYCVRESNKIEMVVDLFAKVTGKLQKLVNYVYEKYENRENCKRLKENFNPDKIVEIMPTSKYTAYSENKGEKIAFCSTTEKGGDTLIDENTLTFVAIHELGHLMSKSIGHTEEFWNNFRFLLKNAVQINIYDPIDYSKNPVEYCSLNINDNPYYED